MATLTERIAILRRCGRTVREEALIEAVMWAGKGEADALGVELIELALRSPQRLRLLGALMSAWAQLGTVVRDAAISAVGEDLEGLLLEMSRDGCPRIRTAAGEAACDVRTGRRHVTSERRRAIGGVMQALVLDGDAGVAQSARDCLVRACDHAAESPDQQGGAVLDDSLERALCAALLGYVEHRHQGIITSALRVAHAPGPAMRKWLAHDDEPGHMALRAAARRLSPELAVPRLVAWMAVPALAPVAAEWAELGGAAARSSLLGSAHLLGLRGRTRAIRRMRAGERLLPSDAQLADDPAPLRRASIRLARLVARPDRRLLHISGFLADPDPLTRMDAVMALGMEPAGPLVDEALTDFTLDPCAVVSASAACVLGSAQSPSRRRAVSSAFRTLMRSPHAVTRSLADHVLREFDPFAPTEGDRTWDHAVPAARALGADGERFRNEALEQLRSGPVRQRVGVLCTLDRLRLIGSVFEEVAALVGDKDQRVAAKAVHLLGKSGDPRAVRVLESVLDHADPRVRAEGVEGLWRLGVPADYGRWTGDQTPRVRANALRALLGVDAERALQGVESMLHDPRATHRAAGLWLAEVGGGSGGLVELTQIAVEMAKRESDPATAYRARRSATRLLARSRLAWAGSDAPGGEHAQGVDENGARVGGVA